MLPKSLLCFPFTKKAVGSPLIFCATQDQSKCLVDHAKLVWVEREEVPARASASASPKSVPSDPPPQMKADRLEDRLVHKDRAKIVRPLSCLAEPTETRSATHNPHILPTASALVEVAEVDVEEAEVDQGEALWLVEVVAVVEVVVEDEVVEEEEVDAVDVAVEVERMAPRNR